MLNVPMVIPRGARPDQDVDETSKVPMVIPRGARPDQDVTGASDRGVLEAVITSPVIARPTGTPTKFSANAGETRGNLNQPKHDSIKMCPANKEKKQKVGNTNSITLPACGFKFKLKDAVRIGILIFLNCAVVGGSSDFLGPEDRTVQKGERVVLECRNSGTRPLKWMKDGIEIFSGFDLREELKHMYSIINKTKGQYDLVINNASNETVGNYSCWQTGDVKFKTARLLMLESESTEGPLEDRELTVPSNNWTSNPVENVTYTTPENGTSPAKAYLWVIAVCVIVSIAATVVTGCVYKYFQQKKKQSESDDVVLKPMIKQWLRRMQTD